MRTKTQDDIVAADQGVQAQEKTVPVALPGIKQLHSRSTDEIAEVLAVVLKSQMNVVRLDWKIGESIELTTRSD